jgi:hypothetical protein
MIANEWSKGEAPIMEELFALRACLEQHRYADALVMVNELEEMSKDDKINKIDSFAVILLLHLIKQAAENRTTRSWDTTIRHAVRQILKTNKRRKAGGTYLAPDEMRQLIRDAYQPALELAALEAFEGRYDADELGAMVDAEAIQVEAYRLCSLVEYPLL